MLAFVQVFFDQRGCLVEKRASRGWQLLAKLRGLAVIVLITEGNIKSIYLSIYTVLFQGRDLDCKIQEYKEVGKTFPESQIIEWFIQLLLGVDYMHERYVHLLLRHRVFFTVMSEHEK